MKKVGFSKKNIISKKMKLVVLLVLLIALFLINIVSSNESENGYKYTLELLENMEKLNKKNEKTILTNKKNVVFYDEYEDTRSNIEVGNVSYKNLTQWEYLRNQFIIDNRTGVNEEILDIDELLGVDLSLNEDNKNKYQVLIFHTHSQEQYIDSKNVEEGVIGVGRELKKVLETKYGIKALHVTESFDIVDGKTQVLGAYERMEPYITNILEQNKSIELVIDIHRDGVSDDVRLVKKVDGKDTAQIMFVNGLCVLATPEGLVEIEDLKNPYLKENLALSFNMFLNGRNSYGDLFRKTYLHAYRYSLHMKPKSLLVEIGAQTNTYEEAINSIEPLADVLYQTLNNK